MEKNQTLNLPSLQKAAISARQPHCPMKTEPSFDQIPIRMLTLGVDRPWLSAQTGYTPDSIRQILAPKGNPKAKTERALKTIWDTLNREQARQEAERAGAEGKIAVRGVYEVRQTADESALVDRAARAVGCESIAEFCRLAILHRAREIMENRTEPMKEFPAPKLVAAEDTPDYDDKTG